MTHPIGYVRTPWEHWLYMWWVIGWHVGHDFECPRSWGYQQNVRV